MAQGSAGEYPLRILFVCTGNICRSALAELAVQRMIEVHSRGATTQVASAGTQAVIDGRMPDESLTVADSYGLNGRPHRGRALTAPMVSASNLILTMTREHRAEIVSRHPNSISRVFTLREFSRIAASTGSITDCTSSIEQIHRQRGMHRPGSPTDDDILDPFRRGMAAHVEAGREIINGLAALDRLVSL